MRKNKAIYATYIGVVATFFMFGMSHFAMASAIFDIEGAVGLASGDSWRSSTNFDDLVSPISQSSGTVYFDVCYHTTTNNGATSGLTIRNNVGFIITGDSGHSDVASGQICRTGSLNNFAGSLVSGNNYGLELSYYAGGNNGSLSLHSDDHFWLSTTNDFSDFVDTTTHVISFDPESGSVVASGTRAVGFDYYVNTNDWDNSVCYSWVLQSIDTNFATSSGSGNCILTAPSFQSFTGTSTLLDGKYTWSVFIKKQKSFFANLFIGGYDTLYSTTSDFYVGSSTLSRSSAVTRFSDRLNALFASSTANLGQSCNPLGAFDMGDCLADIVYPGSDIIDEDLLLIKEMPPWGYAFRLYDIFSDTSSSTLVVLDTTFPSALGFGTPRIRLDLNHSLDFILNATSSIYSSNTASSSDTFYDITSYYWNIVVYLSFGLYVVYRLLGLRKHQV